MSRLLLFLFLMLSVNAAANSKICNVAFGSLALKLAYAERTNSRVSSALKYIDRLSKEADFATRDNRIQKEMNDLLLKELNFHDSNSAGSVNFGMGRLPLGNNYYELRGAHGARLFIKLIQEEDKPPHIIIVGKATKKGQSNERHVFELMEEHFPDFPVWGISGGK